MYISKTDIEDRAILNGMGQYGHDPQEDGTHMFLTVAEDDLNEEHIWSVFELYEATVEALNDQYTSNFEQIAWKMMSGMGPDDECCTDDAGEFYYNQWGIKFFGSLGWRFDHQYENKRFWDIDLMRGMLECDNVDNTALNLVTKFHKDADLNDIEKVMLSAMMVRYTKLFIDKLEELK